MSEIIFTTVHGSHLYGLAHEGSDQDSMIVYRDSREPVHKKSGDDDVIHVGLAPLLRYAEGGSHQYIEGLFSEKKIWHDDSYKALIDGFRIPPANIREKYRRTIHRLCFGTEKHRRHAIRLAFFFRNLELGDGRANPTLTGTERILLRSIASRWEGESLYKFLMFG